MANGFRDGADVDVKPSVRSVQGLRTDHAACPVNQALVAQPSFPPNNVRELIAEAKARPGQLTFASFGNGTSSHLGVELFKQEAGIDMTHVPYKGVAPALQDVLGGQVNVFLTNLPEILPHVQAGKLKVLGVADESGFRNCRPRRRSPNRAFPDSTSILGMASSPRHGTPTPIVKRLHASFAQVLKAPDVAARMGQQGLVILADGPDGFPPLHAGGTGSLRRAD